MIVSRSDDGRLFKFDASGCKVFEGKAWVVPVGVPGSLVADSRPLMDLEFRDLKS